MRRAWRRRAVVVVLAGLGSVGFEGIALAAHPVAGAVYTGNSGKCAAQIRQQCVYKFRVSSDARTLRYIKKSKAVSLWECRGGGGEAIFGSGKYDYRIPTAQIHSNGTFSGTSGAGSRKLLITG